MARLEVPLLNCEGVLSETFHLLEPVDQGTELLLEFLDRGTVVASFSYAEHTRRVHDLMRTYADRPMSFAGACLVRIAEVRSKSRVVTVDDDFRVYFKTEDAPLDVVLPKGERRLQIPASSFSTP